MPTLPPLVRDPPPGGLQSSTGRPVAARMVRTQRQYASGFNISFTYEPPRPIARPAPPAPESTFDKWRAAAVELDPHGKGAGDPSSPAAHGEAAVSGMAATPRRTLHDVLLGTTAVVLLGVLSGIGTLVWSGAVPGTIAPGGTAAKGSSSLAAMVQPIVDLAGKAVTQMMPDHVLSPPPREERTADVSALRPAPQPVAPSLPSIPPNLWALATPLADKPALAGPPLSAAAGPSAEAEEATPAPERTASAPLGRPSAPDAAARAPAMPAATAEAVPLLVPASGQATAAVPPAKVLEPDATPLMPIAEQATAKSRPPVKPPEPDTASPVPALASVTVRLPPAPEWTGATASVSALASPPEAAILPAPPAALSASISPAEPPAVPAVMAKVVPPGVRQQIPLPPQDESLRSRMEMATLARAARMRAWRLKLAEARSAAAAGSDAGGPQAGLPTSVGGGRSLRAAAAVPQQVLRGVHVQKGSPDAVVLSAGPEQADQHLVMVGDQLPGVGRVIAIVQRGGSWIVRTERGVIR